MKPRHRASFLAVAQSKRQERLNQLIRRAASGRPNVVVLDLSEFIMEWPEGKFDPQLRSGLVHFGAEAAVTVFSDFIDPQILRLRVREGARSRE